MFNGFIFPVWQWRILELDRDTCHTIVQTHSHHRTTVSSHMAEIVNSHHCDEEPRHLIWEEGKPLGDLCSTSNQASLFQASVKATVHLDGCWEEKCSSRGQEERGDGEKGKGERGREGARELGSTLYLKGPPFITQDLTRPHILRLPLSARSSALETKPSVHGLWWGNIQDQTAADRNLHAMWIPLQSIFLS